MKKTMKATALFLAAGLLLTACGGKTDTAATTAAAESAKAGAETSAAGDRHKEAVLCIRLYRTVR